MTTLSSHTTRMNGYEAVKSFMSGYETRNFILGRVPMNITQFGSQFNVTMYSTNIITLCGDGTVNLKSGGYKSVTTARFIKIFLPDEWALSAWKLIYQHTGKVFGFSEDLKLYPDGRILTLRDLERGFRANQSVLLSDLMLQGHKLYPVKAKGTYFQHTSLAATEKPVAACAWGCVRAADGCVSAGEKESSVLEPLIGYDPFSYSPEWTKNYTHEKAPNCIHNLIAVLNDHGLDGREMTVPEIAGILKAHEL